MTEQEQKLLAWLNQQQHKLMCPVCGNALDAVTSSKYCAGIVVFCSRAFVLDQDHQHDKLQQFRDGSLQAAADHYDKSSVLFLADTTFESFPEQMRQAIAQQKVMSK